MGLGNEGRSDSKELRRSRSAYEMIQAGDRQQISASMEKNRWNSDTDASFSEEMIEYSDDDLAIIEPDYIVTNITVPFPPSESGNSSTPRGEIETSPDKGQDGNVVCVFVGEDGRRRTIIQDADGAMRMNVAPIKKMKLQSRDENAERIEGAVPASNLRTQVCAHKNPITDLFNQMVLHLAHESGAWKSEIIQISEIMDKFTGEPDWCQLTALLAPNDKNYSNKLVYNEHEEVLLFEFKNIIVGDGRQLVAALRHFMNEGKPNVFAEVCRRDGLRNYVWEKE